MMSSAGHQDAPSLPHTTADGRFVLLRTLGAGAAASVYEATDAGSGQQVALKVFHRPVGAALHASGGRGGDGDSGGGGGATSEFSVYRALGAVRPGGGGSIGTSTSQAEEHGIPAAYEHGGPAHGAACALLPLRLTPMAQHAPAWAAAWPAWAIRAPKLPHARTHAPHAGFLAFGGGPRGCNPPMVPFLSLQLLGPDLYSLAEAGAFSRDPAGRCRLAAAGLGALQVRGRAGA
jgi:hypothetical protein